MKHLRTFAVWAAAGSAACWLPSVVVHLWRGSSIWQGSHIAVPYFVLLTVAQPMGALSLFLFSRSRKQSDEVRVVVPFAICAGLWILGPAWMYVAPLLGGGLITGPHPVGPLYLAGFITVATLIFPLSTFMLSTSEGSLGGVLLTTIIMTAIWLVLLRNGNPTSA